MRYDFFATLLVAIFGREIQAVFDDHANLERTIPLDVEIPNENIVKYIDLIVPEVRAPRFHVDEVDEMIRSFLESNDYVFYPKGIRGCHKPLLMQKALPKVMGLVPYRDIPEYDLYSLEYNGYDIRFPYEQFETSPLLQGFKKKGILIEDLNDLITALVFLSKKSNDEKWWSKLNENILADEKNADILDRKKSKLIEEIKTFNQYPIDSNSILVQHMLYNGVRLDDVETLLIVLRYLEYHKLKVEHVFYSSGLDKYFEKANLMRKRRHFGDRVGLDHLLSKHNFDYLILIGIINVEINKIETENDELAKMIHDEIDSMDGKKNNREENKDESLPSKNEEEPNSGTVENTGESHENERRQESRPRSSVKYDSRKKKGEFGTDKR